MKTRHRILGEEVKRNQSLKSRFQVLSRPEKRHCRRLKNPWSGVISEATFYDPEAFAPPLHTVTPLVDDRRTRVGSLGGGVRQNRRRSQQGTG